MTREELIAQIVADPNASPEERIEAALDPVKGIGLLPISIDGHAATSYERVAQLAIVAKEYDRQLTELAKFILGTPGLVAEMEKNDSAGDLAVRLLKAQYSK